VQNMVCNNLSGLFSGRAMAVKSLHSRDALVMTIIQMKRDLVNQPLPRSERQSLGTRSDEA